MVRWLAAGPVGDVQAHDMLRARLFRSGRSPSIVMNNALYNQIRIFQAIAQEGGITAASRKLEITPPSVSKALKLLEQQVGLPLFLRSTRRVELTDAGRALLERTTDAVQSLQWAVESVRSSNMAPAGLVRVTMSRFAYQLIFRPLMAEFCRQHPQVQLELSIYDGTIHILDEGFDLGIRFGNTLEDGVVARRLLAPFREGLYVSQAYVDRHGVPQRPRDLHRHVLIGYRFITANRVLPLILQEDGQDLTVEMPFQLMSNDIEVMADGIRDGLGIGRIFEPIRALQPDRDSFLPVLERWWKTYPGVYLYHLQHAQKQRRVQALIDFLVARLTV